MATAIETTTTTTPMTAKKATTRGKLTPWRARRAFAVYVLGCIDVDRDLAALDEATRAHLRSAIAATVNRGKSSRKPFAA